MNNYVDEYAIDLPTEKGRNQDLSHEVSLTHRYSLQHFIIITIKVNKRQPGQLDGQFARTFCLAMHSGGSGRDWLISEIRTVTFESEVLAVRVYFSWFKFNKIPNHTV